MFSNSVLGNAFLKKRCEVGNKSNVTTTGAGNPIFIELKDNVGRKMGNDTTKNLTSNSTVLGLNATNIGLQNQSITTTITVKPNANDTSPTNSTK